MLYVFCRSVSSKELTLFSCFSAHKHIWIPKCNLDSITTAGNRLLLYRVLWRYLKYNFDFHEVGGQRALKSSKLHRIRLCFLLPLPGHAALLFCCPFLSCIRVLRTQFSCVRGSKLTFVGFPCSVSKEPLRTQEQVPRLDRSVPHQVAILVVITLV